MLHNLLSATFFMLHNLLFTITRTEYPCSVLQQFCRSLQHCQPHTFVLQMCRDGHYLDNNQVRKPYSPGLCPNYRGTTRFSACTFDFLKIQNGQNTKSHCVISVLIVICCWPSALHLIFFLCISTYDLISHLCMSLTYHIWRQIIASSSISTKLNYIPWQVLNHIFLPIVD